MYPHQAERLTAALDRAGLDALVATSPENVRYVTGFSSVSQAVYRDVQVFGVVTRGRTGLVVPTIDAATVAADGADVDVVRCYGTFFLVIPGAPAPPSGRPEAGRLQEWIATPAGSAADALAAVLDAVGVRDGRIGLDESALSSTGWRDASERLAGATLSPGANLLAAARMVKGPYEIECLDRATRIAEEAVNAVLQILKPGMTEREAVAAYEAEVVKRGATPCRSLITSGERSALPAAAASERALRMRDLVRFDLGCVVNGYRSDLARTAVMGEPNSRQATAHDAVLTGVEAALDAICPGARPADVFEAGVGAVRAAGLADYQRHHVGHGIGLEAREAPHLAPGGEPALETGMVLRVETPYYEYGWGGVSVKEMVLVTNAGARSMNRSARGLVVLD